MNTSYIIDLIVDGEIPNKRGIWFTLIGEESTLNNINNIGLDQESYLNGCLNEIGLSHRQSYYLYLSIPKYPVDDWSILLVLVIIIILLPHTLRCNYSRCNNAYQILEPTFPKSQAKIEEKEERTAV